MRIILVIFVILKISVLFANEDHISSFHKDHIEFNYKTGSSHYEIGYKVEMLTILTSKLWQSKKYTNDIYFYFDHDYSQTDTTYCALGYGAFTLSKNDEKSDNWKTKNTTGIKLVVRSRDLNIKSMLQLINSAVNNINYIKETQKPFVIDLNSSINGVPQFDTLYTIQPTDIKKYFAANDTTIDRIINTKTFLESKYRKENYGIEYYYQNNKFHFYKTRSADEGWSVKEAKYIATKTYEDDLLVVDDILEIVTGLNDGRFVFTNDSTFYYFPRYKDTVSGPFVVDGVIAGRPPILEYYHEYSPIERYILFIDNRRNTKKAIFFPDSNIVISNFDKVENDFINSLLKKPKVKRDTNSIIITVLIFLAISIIINILLLLRQRK